MKKVFPLLFALVFHFCQLGAQITVTSASFPAIGDTLHLASTVDVPGLVITGSGGPQTWDYAFLQPTITQKLAYRSPTEGSVSITGANLFALQQADAEYYYKVSSSAMELLAVKGPVAQVFGVTTLWRLSPPRLERRAPLTYPSSKTSNSNLLIPFSTEVIPSEILDSLGLPVVPDSIRLRIASHRTDEVDAFGTLTLPSGNYDALRETRTEMLDTRVDVLLPIFGWQDVTDLLITSGIIPGLGQDTVRSYLFFGNTAKEVLLEITTGPDDQTPQQATFRYPQTLNAVDDNTAVPATVSAVPNPFSAYFDLTLEGLAPGSYRVSLFDMQGKAVYQNDLAIVGQWSERIALDPYPAGTYLLQVQKAGSGKVVGNTQVVKIDR